jgi:hypothetical protein
MKILGYTVKLISKDGQGFIFRTNNLIKEEVIKLALKSIKDKGWDRFEYKFDNIKQRSENE